MSDTAKKKLFFIKSKHHNLKPIEVFLSKRNYEVFTESDIKNSLVKVIETEAKYIFIAIDHTDPKVALVPKVLGQSTNVQIIAYAQSSSKDAIRKLEFSGFQQKLYPPISGPAIERLISKLSKDMNNEVSNQYATTGQPTREDMLQIKSDALKRLDEESYNLNLDSTQEKSARFVIQKGTRGALLKTKNSSLQQFKQSHIASETKKELKIEFDQEIRAQIEDMIETYEGYNKKTEMGYISEGANDIASTPPTNHDLLADNSSGGLNSLNSVNAIELSKKKLSRAYCMTVQSQSWCGYLVLCSDCEIDFSTSQSLFKKWLEKNFENLSELEDSEQFEIKLVHAEFRVWAQSKADYYEFVTKHESEVILSFFSVDPNSLIVELNDNDQIEVPTSIIPVNKELSLSFYLHLPENKKYLLYTPQQQSLTPAQHQRLLDKKVNKLFTPIEFEKDFRKLVAEYELDLLYQSIKKETSA